MGVGEGICWIPAQVAGLIPAAWRESTNTVMFGIETGNSQVVGDSDSDATKWSSQRKTFWAKGRYWVFYTRDENIVFKSSPDGKTWSQEYIGSVEHYADYHYANNYHYMEPTGYFDVYGKGDVVAWFAEEQFWFDNVAWSGYNYVFRKGILNSDGTIDWDDPVEVYYSGSEFYDSNFPAISRAADGTWWVASSVNTSGTDHYYKIWSSPDGITFTERYSEALAGARYTTTQILPQKSGSVVYFVFVAYNDKTSINWMKWDGSSIGTRQTKAISNAMGSGVGNVKSERFSATIDSDDIMNIVWLRILDSSICYLNWDGTTWGDETVVEQVASGITRPCIGVDEKFVHLFWLRVNVIYHREYDGSWHDSDTPFGTSFASPTYLTCGKDIGP